MNKIDVIIPVYNGYEYLARCIKSIINQSYKNLNIILVDDGSIDSSSILCDEFILEDVRIIVIHKHNGGLSSARNIAIELHEGEYVTFVDGDDCIHSRMIEWMAHDMEVNDPDFVTTGLHEFSEMIPDEVLTIGFDLLNRDDFIKHLYPDNFGKISVTACGKLYKKEIFKDFRYPEGMIYEDLHVFFSLLNKSSLITATNEPLYFWFNRRNSITRSQYMMFERFEEFIARKKIADYYYANSLIDQAEYASNDYLTFFFRNYYAVMLKYKQKKSSFSVHVKDFRKDIPRILKNSRVCRMRKICSLICIPFPHLAYFATKYTIPDCLIEEMR